MAEWITDQRVIGEILDRAPVGHLGLVSQSEPYVVPVHFVHADNRIGFHSGLSGRKTEILRQGPRVCFEVNELLRVVPNQMACFFTAHYRSVIAWGTARLVDDDASKLRWLNLLIDKYQQLAGGVDVQPLPEQAAALVNVYEIEIEELTAKAKLPEES